ncbi:MAG: LicD family protein [Lachnospiraceae bacterium]|nr:LicD family protein [Lachnospiraceae bacterium]
MRFKEDFFEGEVREGFYVRPIMKRCWAAELEVLEEISRICRIHKLKWYAGGGTILGTARHQGFIPWDDDLDIQMPRADYERFVHYACKELPKGWFVSNIRGSANQSQPFVCVINSRKAINLDQKFLKRFHGCPYAVGVDIGPVDAVPDDEEERESYRILVGAAIDIGQSVRPDAKINECSDAIIGEANDLEEICGMTFDRNKPIAPQAYELADQLSAMYNDTDTGYYTVAAYYHSKPELLFPKEAYAETVYMPFENTKLPLMSGYEHLLRAYYGDDYMTPIRNTAFHNYPFFKNAEEELRRIYDEQGKDFPEEFE